MRDHVPRHLLEQMVVDDPRAPVRPVLRVHVAACDRCSMRQRALEAARTGYLALYPALEFSQAVLTLAAQPEPTQRRGLAALKPAWLLSAAALSIVAPVLAVLWISQRSSVSQPTAADAPLRIMVQHGATSRELEDGAQLTADDRLLIEYRFEQPRHLLLLGIDAGGTIRRYFPSDASQAVPLAATRAGRLPIDVELGVRPSEEQLFALLSERPLDEVAVRGTLADAMNHARANASGIAGLSRLDLPAQQLRVRFRRP